MKSYSAQGIIIKRTNFGEADKIITLYSPDRGKFSLLARGVRKLTSKRAGSLELFNRVKISAVTGRGHLDTLTEVSLFQSYTPWRRHLGRVNIAYQLCEVIDKLLPDSQSHPNIYQILSLSLSQISELDNNWQNELNNWLLKILIDLGYWPEEKKFTGDINKFIESLIQRPLNSHKILKMLS
jgi:DNA repair protein RecO (recombination protein O)